MTGRGIGIGAGVFAVLAGLLYLTPLRKPVMAVAGREYPALQYRLQAQRDSLDALQRRAATTSLSPAERAALNRVRSDYVATRESADAWGRMNARISPLGFLDWASDLLPWLLTFALALPLFGGLIGAQIARGPRPAPSPNPAAHVAPAPMAPVRSTVPGAPVAFPPAAAPAAGPARAIPGSFHYVPPTPVADRKSGEVPGAAPKPPEDWGFRHQPTPLDSRPRSKMPPVRSPHAPDAPSDEARPA